MLKNRRPTVTSNTSFGVVLLAILILTACASGYRDSRPTVAEPLSLKVVDEIKSLGVRSRAKPPELADEAFEVPRATGAFGGLLAGGAAGAGIGAAACPPAAVAALYLGYGTCVAVSGLLGSLVGLVGGSVTAEFLHTDPANAMLPPGHDMQRRLREEVISAVRNSFGVVARDLGTVSRLPSAPAMAADPNVVDELGIDEGPPEAVLEVGLMRVSAIISRRENYYLTLLAQSRLTISGASESVLRADHGYESPSIDGGEGRETDRRRVDAAVTVALKDLARQIVARQLHKQ